FVTFPEGKSIADMAAIVAAADLDAGEFLAAAQSSALIHDLDPQAHDLEGYLFPDTYDIPTGTQPAAALVEHMVLRFREIWTDEMRDAPHGDLTTREIVTLASLVELESARGEERPMIAAVFLNRLKKKMRLQTDPTVIYALKRGGHYDGNIRKADLAMDSPYNTYRRPGLPPGPIAAPGREALRAALHPAQSDALYFVSRNDGTHQFSRTLAEHERAVDRYQRRRRRANNG
ncbi:MAG: endolytic transglycosylase MltG, partial [Vicinamibacteria bacterium]|nr:endolytic transglycosylase MltG [Vicinamibacteria bacterium]